MKLPRCHPRALRAIALLLAALWVIAAAIVTITDHLGPTYLEQPAP